MSEWTVMHSAELTQDLLHQGNLRIAGDLELTFRTPSELVVEGDLEVQGSLLLREGAQVIVRGDLWAHNVGCEGSLYVEGDLVVAETVFGYYESGTTEVKGVLFADLFLEGNHDFEISTHAARLHVRFSNFSQDLSEDAQEQLRGVLHERALLQLAGLVGFDSEGDSSGDLFGLLRDEGFLRSPRSLDQARAAWIPPLETIPHVTGEQWTALLGVAWDAPELHHHLRQWGFRGALCLDDDGDLSAELSAHKVKLFASQRQGVSVLEFCGPSEHSTLPLGLTWERCREELSQRGLTVVRENPEYSMTIYDAERYHLRVYLNDEGRAWSVSCELPG